MNRSKLYLKKLSFINLTAHVNQLYLQTCSPDFDLNLVSVWKESPGMDPKFIVCVCNFFLLESSFNKIKRGFIIIGVWILLFKITYFYSMDFFHYWIFQIFKNCINPRLFDLLKRNDSFLPWFKVLRRWITGRGNGQTICIGKNQFS